MFHAWRFSRTNGSLIAPIVRFLPRGLIGGYIHPNERGWDIRDNCPVLLNQSGVATTIFTKIALDEVDGLPHVMAGPALIAPGISHVLTRTVMPTALDFGQMSRQTLPEFVRYYERPRRRNLVILRADNTSLHTQWPRNLDNTDRNWDFCISWYGKNTPCETEIGPHEFLTLQPEDRKFGAINAMFQSGSPFWGYERVSILDDDLMTSWLDINRLFEICRRHELLLAQPALTPNENVTHAATAHNALFALRYTNFVEAMCPVFEIEALRVCLPTFNGSIGGFGLDHIWPRLLGLVNTRMAIIDDVVVTHTRPIGQNYDLGPAIEEEHKIRHLYGCDAPLVFETVGGLRADKLL